MALSNKPASTSLQVGNYGWFIYNNSPVKAKILKTISDVSNPNNDTSGVQNNFFYFEGYTEKFSSSQVYSSKSELTSAITAATPS
ncbi:MAG: hypothetical protein J0M18_12565 [Ignavibacteria bacterium]|jgi:hypothetical protein|nr:hypothetical protein [Ignavibacteria bacterium]